MSFASRFTVRILIALTCPVLYGQVAPIQNAPLSVNTESGLLTFVSLEAGIANFATADNQSRAIALSKLPMEDQRRIMERTGWGRVWEDNTGNYHTIGDLVEVVEGAVVLENVDGKKLVVALDRLSAQDRKYAEARRATSGALPNQLSGKSCFDK